MAACVEPMDIKDARAAEAPQPTIFRMGIASALTWGESNFAYAENVWRRTFVPTDRGEGFVAIGLAASRGVAMGTKRPNAKSSSWRRVERRLATLGSLIFFGRR